MKRITLDKNSHVKSLVLDGLRFQEYDLVSQTYASHPIYLYFQAKSKRLAIYNCKATEDEFIFLDTANPEKLRIVMNEIMRYGKEEAAEITDRLNEIINYKKPGKVDVIYISQI